MYIFPEEDLQWLLCTYVGSDVSFISFKYTKGKGAQTGRQILFTLLTVWQTWQMNNVALYLDAPAVVFCVKMPCP